MSGEMISVSLSRPAANAAPTAAPSTTAGLSATGTPAPEAAANSVAAASRAPTLVPTSAAGTSPKYDSAEYRPPMSAGLMNTRR